MVFFGNSLRFYIVALAITLGALSVNAAQVKPVPVALGGEVKITLHTYYDELPGIAYFPLRVVIENESSRNRVWQITGNSTSNSYYLQGKTQVFDLQVEGNSTRTFDLMFPVVGGPRLNGKYLNVSVSGPGINSFGVSHLSLNTRFRPEDWQLVDEFEISYMVGVSPEIHKQHLEAAEFFRENYLFNHVVIELVPGNMPPHWMGYLGVEIFYCTVTDWKRFSESERAVLLDWVSTGGEIELLGLNHHSETFESLGLPLSAKENERFGLGRVGISPFTYEESYADLLAYVKGGMDDSKVVVRSAFLANGFDTNWDSFFLVEYSMDDLVAPFKFNSKGLPWLLGILLYVFLIGPANYIILRKKNKLPLLYLSVPVTAILFGVVFVGFLLLTEGVGTQGKRMRFTVYMPEVHKALVLQTQTSTTGLVDHEPFGLPEEVDMRNVADMFYEGDLDYSYLHYNQNNRKNNFLYRNSIVEDGFFKPRTTQSQFSQYLMASRSGVSILPRDEDAAPEINSRLNAKVSELFYVDGKGKVWKVESLAPGETKTMKEGGLATFAVWLEKYRDVLGPMTHYRTVEIGAHKNWFFGLKEPHPEDGYDINEAIEWQDELHMIAGPIGGGL